MLLSRSIFLQLIFPFILASGILTFILSMETLYRLIYLIVERGVSVFSVGLLLLYRLPQFLSVTLPLAIVIASVVLMVRLSTDNEIYAMNAIGISYWQIGRPFFLFGIVTTILALSITLWLQPAGYAAFEEEKIRVLKTQTTKTIQPLVLNYDFPDKVLHVQDKGENEDLSGVFITDRELSADSMVTLADRGRINVREGERDLVLSLEDGRIHLQGSAKNYRTIAFEKFHYIFRPLQIVPEKKDGHIWGVSTSALWINSSQSSQIELFLRLTTPWACVAFAVAMVPLGLVNPRRGRSGAFLRGLILVVFYYLLWMGAKEMTQNLNYQPHVLWLPPLLIWFFGLYSLYKNNLNRSNIIDLLSSVAKIKPRTKQQVSAC
ncbi:MAG: LptF/LptG family permease [SAR324 cluster bacterium]|nr:LptF/LptG family permease [SAR324 cluster bacterium]